MLFTLFSAVFLILLISKPAVCTSGAAKGLTLWYEQVLPALFPAMAAASFLISRKRIQAALRHLPFPAATAFLSGLLCGSPMGTLTCSGLCSSGLISKRQGRWILCLVQLPSPLFLFGFTASVSLGLADPFIFAFCLYLPFFASFLTCIVSALHTASVRTYTEPVPSASKNPVSPKTVLEDTVPPENLPEEPTLTSVCDTCLLLLVQIGVLLMFFSILSELFSEFLLSFPLKNLHPEFLIGLLEMTTGISKIAASFLPLRIKAALCLFLLNYGGICIHIQVCRAWKHDRFPWIRYELIRLAFGLFSSISYLFLTN